MEEKLNANVPDLDEFKHPNPEYWKIDMPKLFIFDEVFGYFDTVRTENALILNEISSFYVTEKKILYFC